ncbi:hypothetical protein D3C75_875180 [compost metagenome]
MLRHLPYAIPARTYHRNAPGFGFKEIKTEGFPRIGGQIDQHIRLPEQLLLFLSYNRSCKGNRFFYPQLVNKVLELQAVLRDLRLIGAGIIPCDQQAGGWNMLPHLMKHQKLLVDILHLLQPSDGQHVKGGISPSSPTRVFRRRSQTVLHPDAQRNDG